MNELSTRDVDSAIATLVEDARPALLHEAAGDLLAQSGAARFCIAVENVIRKIITALAGEISELRDRLRAAGVDKAAAGIDAGAIGRSAVAAVCGAANEALDAAAKQLAEGRYKNVDVKPFRKAVDDVRQQWLALLEESRDDRT